MQSRANLPHLADLYSQGVNIIDYLRGSGSSVQPEAIMASYDLQAGSYIKAFLEREDFYHAYASRLAETVRQLGVTGRILEAGVGEATSMVSLLDNLGDYASKFDAVYGFDISWSRVRCAKIFCERRGYGNNTLFTGSLFHIPCLDNYFDLVYTVDAIEPNGGREEEILRELYRVCGKWLVLLEPAYEFAPPEAKQRMLDLGYITKLHEAAVNLGYKIMLHDRYGVDPNPLNTEGIIVIEKNATAAAGRLDSGLACPVSKKPLTFVDNAYYCAESMLAYPEIRGIPCLNPENAVVAARFLTDRATLGLDDGKERSV